MKIEEGDLFHLNDNTYLLVIRLSSEGLTDECGTLPAKAIVVPIVRRENLDSWPTGPHWSCDGREDWDRFDKQVADNFLVWAHLAPQSLDSGYVCCALHNNVDRDALAQLERVGCDTDLVEEVRPLTAKSLNHTEGLGYPTTQIKYLAVRASYEVLGLSSQLSFDPTSYLEALDKARGQDVRKEENEAYDGMEDMGL